ncbi:ROK family transcriptional regulator [Galactobacter caseinivorans]|uniref:ROK family protein n=1 Tax=Galactobacter caseinivorans TaxID=2676123 RepID=A0A496PIZ8_9MICC|nr:ROK family protein [Galactobacter caseinivorans]RKW70472.1 ROK family protein [Galactobacter caseinivorans]
MSHIIGSDVSSLRHVNRAGALQRLRRAPDDFQTAADVAEPLGLSRPTAARLLTELAESGWAELQLAHTGSAGRPARTFRLNRHHALVAAVDVGANNVLVAIADLSGEVLQRSYAPHGFPDSATEMSDLVAGSLRQLLKELRGPDGEWEQLLAVSVSVPATVDRQGVIHPQSDSPSWATQELADRLRRAISGPTVRFDSAPTAALRAELEHGELRRYEDGVFVLAGDITGVAPLVNQVPYLGAGGAAGAIGGLHGVDWRHATDAVLQRTGAHNLDELVSWGLQERPDAIAALRSYTQDLTSGVEVLVRSFDPAVLVLGGCLAPAGHLVLEPLGEALELKLGAPPPRMVCARVDHVDAPVLGGLAAALAAVEWGA